MRQIAEGRAEDQRVIITEHVLAAIQFVGDWDACHPRLCWHSHVKVWFPFLPMNQLPGAKLVQTLNLTNLTIN